MSKKVHLGVFVGSLVAIIIASWCMTPSRAVSDESVECTEQCQAEAHAAANPPWLQQIMAFPPGWESPTMLEVAYQNEYEKLVKMEDQNSPKKEIEAQQIVTKKAAKKFAAVIFHAAEGGPDIPKNTVVRFSDLQEAADAMVDHKLTPEELGQTTDRMRAEFLTGAKAEVNDALIANISKEGDEGAEAKQLFHVLLYHYHFLPEDLGLTSPDARLVPVHMDDSVCPKQ